MTSCALNPDTPAYHGCGHCEPCRREIAREEAYVAAQTNGQADEWDYDAYLHAGGKLHDFNG